MSRKAQDCRRRRRPVGVHAGGRRDVVGQEGRRHRRLCVEVGHAAGRHGHVMVVEAVVRREACGRLQVPLGVHVGRDGRHRRRRRPVLAVAQAQQFLDGERRSLRHGLGGLIQDAGRCDVDGVL